MSKPKHPSCLIMRKYEGRYLYGFYTRTQEEGLYLLANRENFVEKVKHNDGQIYFFDLDRDAK